MGKERGPARCSPHTLVPEAPAAAFSSWHYPDAVGLVGPVGVHRVRRRLASGAKINLYLGLGIVMRSKAGRHRKGERLARYATTKRPYSRVLADWRRSGKRVGEREGAPAAGGGCPFFFLVREAVCFFGS